MIVISKQQVVEFQLRKAVSAILASSSLDPFPSLTGEAYARALTVWEHHSSQRSLVLKTLCSLVLEGEIIAGGASSAPTSSASHAKIIRVLSVGCGDASMDLKILNGIAGSLKQRTGQTIEIDYVGVDLNPSQVYSHLHPPRIRFCRNSGTHILYVLIHVCNNKG